MNEQTVAHVAAILDTFNKGRQAEAAAREVTKLRSESLRREFMRLQESVIVPAMREIGELVRNYGHQYEIEAASNFLDLRSAEPRTRLLLTLTLKSSRQHKPSLDAICDTSDESVRFEIRIPTRGSFVAQLASAAVVNLDPPFVHARAVEFLEQAFDGKPL